MREIKFREWDQAREDMMPGHGMSYSEREEFDDSVSFRFEHEEDLDYTERQSETDCHGTPYRVLEQYTGVDDVSGKPIYEGDIVRDEDGICEQVVFSDGGFFAGDMSVWDASLGYVIGNIHENPDLLEIGYIQEEE